MPKTLGYAVGITLGLMLVSMWLVLVAIAIVRADSLLAQVLLGMYGFQTLVQTVINVMNGLS